MSWKTKAIKDLAISDGLAISLKEKLKVEKCGPLAEAFTTRHDVIKGFGTGAYDVLVRELMNISKGEFEAMLPKPENAAPAETANEVALDPEGRITLPQPDAAKNESSANANGVAIENVGQEAIKGDEIAVVTGAKEDGTLTVRRAKGKKGALEAGPVAADDAERSKLIALRHAADIILKQREKVREADAEFDTQKEVLKSAKKAKERERDNLVEMLDELVDQQPRLPGMSSLKPEKPAPAEAATNEQPSRSLKAAESDKPDWRKESVTVLISPGLGSTTIKKLVEANIRTMEDLHYAFLANKVYTIEGMSSDKADKIRERSLEWFNSNRADVDVDPSTEIRLIKDLLASDGKVICEAGARLPISMFGDGGVGCVHGGIVHRMTSDQWEGIARPKMIQITKPVPGADNEKDNMVPGVEVEVLRWHGKTAVVKSPSSGREILVAPEEFEAL